MPINNNLSLQTSKIYAIILIFLAGIIAFIWLFSITTYGPGVSPDSTVYIETADNILAGNGFYAGNEPVTHYPPLYPLLLAIVKVGVPDTLLAGRLLHALLFSINVTLVGIAAFLFTEHNPLLATACTLLIILSSAPILVTHAMAWSESPFITFSLLALIFLSLYIANSSLPLLLVSSLMFGLAIATRYVGLSLFFALLFGLLILSKKPFEKRLHDAFIAIVIASVPIGMWLIRNSLVADSVTNRNLTVHLVEWRHWNDLINTLSNFILPLPVPPWIKLIHLTILLALFVGMLRLFYQEHRTRKSTVAVFVSINLVFILSYMVFLLLSISLFDAYTPLDSRVLLPVYIALVFIAVLGVSTLVSKWQSPHIRLALFFFLVLVIMLNGVHVIREANYIQQAGLGYASQVWGNSATLQAVSTFDDNVKIYSNGPDALYFWTGQNVDIMPYRIFPTTLETNTDYEAQLDNICTKVKAGHAIVVYFHGISRWYLLAREEFETQCGREFANRLEDGVIYDKTFGGN
jgi:hypothetical protein